MSTTAPRPLDAHQIEAARRAIQTNRIALEGTLSLADWLYVLRLVFRYGSDEKVCHAGRVASAAIKKALGALVYVEEGVERFRCRYGTVTFVVDDLVGPDEVLLRDRESNFEVESEQRDALMMDVRAATDTGTTVDPDEIHGP